MNRQFKSLIVIGLSVAIFFAICHSFLEHDRHLSVSKSTNNVSNYLVQGKDAKFLVGQLNSKITHDLTIINAVAANLTESQVARLRLQGLRVLVNESVRSTGLAWGQRIDYTEASAVQMSNVQPLHDQRLFGDGVTLVVLDSGVKTMTGIRHDVYDRHRVYGTYNAINNKVSMNDDEESGHGTHVASVAINSEFDAEGHFYGIAPNARLISIKAFDQDGNGRYADVIRGIQWAIYFKDTYNIRVLNLSFSSEARSYYWNDPVNQAVMLAWQSGITVITSAGNTGTAGSIGVPGNNPYIITVGAVTDNYTPNDYTDDRLAKFSSSGPTFERFVKPEIVAPGGHLMGLMSNKMQLAMNHPEFHDGGKYFTMSGTSQSAAVVSGIAALMISADPSLSPDTIKCRLISTARPALTQSGESAYSPFQQGAGQVDAYRAVLSKSVGCANRGLDIGKDLQGEMHFSGPARMTETGAFYIEGDLSQLWSGEAISEQGYTWGGYQTEGQTGESDTSLWPDASSWSDTSLWPDYELWNSTSLWPDTTAWSESSGQADTSLWPDTTIANNIWVDQE